jgi:DNA-binding response OmpR family regulator
MKTPIKILLIEDDPDDVELLRDSLNNFDVFYEMNVINDGALVSDYLKTNREIPDVIVLDLNLPRVHGKEILKEIKFRSIYSEVPLLILTTSSAREDMEYSYQHGAKKFLRKPTNMEGIQMTVRTIVELAGS